MGKAPKKKAEEAPPADDGGEEGGEGGGGGSTSNNVYVKDKQYAWVPARMESSTADKAKVSVALYKDEGSIASDGGKDAVGWEDRTVNLKEYPNKTLPLQNVKGGDLIMKEDMVDLPFLHEPAILYNVKARHCMALPYTRTGDIVIAVNPYQWLTHLYTEEQQLLYAAKLVWEEVEGDPKKFVEPHVYETSALCYRGLAADRIDQSILVSGESGAGKTETVKICMNHVASVQRGPVTDGGEYTSAVVQRVLDSNPLLEAFGNAKTRRNDNSSRFGKYINLQFKRKDRMPGENFERCELAGSKCDVYLLEKSRICGHEEIEGTYHIFYQILGANEGPKAVVWDGLKGTDYDSFKIVGTPPYTRMIEGMTDAQNYDATVKSLALIHVKDDKLVTLMRSICITLALGNITFGQDPSDEERSLITNMDAFAKAHELHGGEAKQLELAFTERTMKTRTDTFKVPLKHDVAKDGCDAYAKEIYAKTFLWLVREINSATCAEENYEGGGQRDFGLIGLLDIFGFESFPINGFEQLCINYANEKLQQKFTKDIFEAVQEEYEQEGIDLDKISYDDNSDVLELIEGRTGLIKMLNEECVRPKGDDKTFVSKAISGNKGADCLIHERTMKPTEFGVHHYAGKVVYLADGFVGRNNDSLPVDLHESAACSANEIISKHLKNEAMMKMDMQPEAPKDDKKKKGGSGSDTIWTKFKTQLGNLMTGLSTTNSRYIRCLKPNTVKKPLIMFHTTTIEQLRCAGVVAAVTISRSAFPNRIEHQPCLDRFKAMREKGVKFSGDAGADCVALLDPALKKFEDDEGNKGYVMGKTRVYFKGGVFEFLEQERMKHWSKWVIEVQKVARGWLIRKKLSSIKLQAKTPQAVQIQSWFRCFVAKHDVKKRKKRIKIMKKNAKKRGKMCIKIQAFVRACLVRPAYKKMLREKHEKDILKNEIKEMEAKAAEAEKKRQQEVEEAKAAAEKEIEEYKALVKEEAKSNKERQKKVSHQLTLIEESAKIIEYLRKEHTKLKTQNETLKKDFKSLKENNSRLMEANASASQSFTALNEHAKELNGKNAELIKEVTGYKKEMEGVKNDLKTRQAYYLAEAESRLAYQKTMAQIVTSIQDKCRDPQLVEDVVIMALECEASAKAERTALDSNAQKKRQEQAAAQKAAREAAAASRPAPAKKAADSDSDSDSDSD